MGSGHTSANRNSPQSEIGGESASRSSRGTLARTPHSKPVKGVSGYRREFIVSKPSRIQRHQVDEALRKLLEGKAEVAITVESIVEMLAKLDTVAPVTMVEVVPGNLVK